MLRGINKQIIEVKCTNNEYFEKILLFVKPKSLILPVKYYTFRQLTAAALLRLLSLKESAEASPKQRRQ